MKVVCWPAVRFVLVFLLPIYKFTLCEDCIYTSQKTFFFCFAELWWGKTPPKDYPEVSA